MATREKRAPRRATRKHRTGRPFLASVSNDWYWEQDADLRFTRIEVQPGMPEERELARLNLGKQPWQTGVSVEGGWDAHRALLAARQTFHDVLMWRDLENGGRRYISVSGEPVFDAAGAFKGYRGIGRDISASKRRELLLYMQHAVTLRLADSANPEEAIRGALQLICERESWDYGELWRLDEKAGVLRRFAGWAQADVDAARRFDETSRSLEFRPGEGLVGKVWQSGEPLWLPDTAVNPPGVRGELARAIGLRGAFLCPVASTGRRIGVLVFVCRRARPLDEAQWLTLTALAVQFGLFLRRMEAESQLRESEARFRRTFELAGSGIAHVGLDGRFLRVNRRLCELLGYAEGELLGLSVKDVSHPEDRDASDAERMRLHAGEIDTVAFEKRYRRKDGTSVWASVVAAVERDAEGRPLYDIAIFENIDARKAAEEALRESEARYRRTFELAGSGVAHIGLDRRFIRVNRKLCEILGYEEHELVGRFVPEFSHPEDQNVVDRNRLRLLAGEIESFRMEKRYVRKDGSIVWATATVALERDAAGRPLYVISVFDDVSARKAAEAALRESESRFRSLATLSADWFWEQDAQFRFTRLEGRGSAAYPERSELLLGAKRWEIGLEVEGGWEAHRALLESRQPFHDVLMWRRMADGGLDYVSVSGEPVFDAEGRFCGYRGVARDVTAQKHAERLLRLEHQVARALSEATSATAGMQAVMQLVCEAEDWDCGRYFAVDVDAERVFYRQGWMMPGRPFESFLRASEGLVYAPGQGLVGRVWATGEPVWSTDTSRDPRVMAKALAMEYSRGAFVFALVAEGATVGVLSFTSRQVRPPDERLLQASRVIGSQVGQFLRRMRAEETLRRFRLAMDNSADMILLVERARMRYVDVNATACNLLGYSRAELLAMGPQDLLPIPRETLEREYDALIAQPVQVGLLHSEYRCKDGSRLPFESSRRVLASDSGPIIVAVARDIRERIAAEEALRESEARFRALTQLSSDFFWETDREHRFTSVVHGPSYSQRMGRIVGRTAWEIPSTHPDEAGWARLRASMDAQQPFRDFEFGRPEDDGRSRYFSLSGEPHFGAEGRFLGYRGVGRDITETVLARERIASLAYHDPLTGLANRTSLAPALEQALQRTRRRGSRLAGLFIDFDGFKAVNDAYGHDAGDRVLIEVARRLRSALRAADPVARLGGDEFFVVLEDLQDKGPAERVARKLLTLIAEPCDLGAGRVARVSASIGISIYPDDAGDAATLIKHADIAMYAAKQAGKNSFRFFMSAGAANDARPADEEDSKTL